MSGSSRGGPRLEVDSDVSARDRVVGVAALGVLLAGVVLLDMSDVGAAAGPGRTRLPTSVCRRRPRREWRLFRARALVARGRLAEALQRLDGVAAASPERAEADSLRIEIQQLLLASVRSSSGSAPTEAVRR